MQIDKIEYEDQNEYYMWDENFSKILAYAMVEKGDGLAKIQIINVASEFRNNGMGSKLLAKILEDFEGVDITALTFEDRIAWYERHGFSVEGKEGDLIKVLRQAS